MSLNHMQKVTSHWFRTSVSETKQGLVVETCQLLQDWLLEVITSYHIMISKKYSFTDQFYYGRRNPESQTKKREVLYHHGLQR